MLTILGVRSSLAQLLPFDAASAPANVWVYVAVVVALLPAWLARETPLPAAGAIVVPLLGVASYGASRLDWLRVLKDFGVSEPAVLAPFRLALGALALLLLWALHAADLATRLRSRAIERGIEPTQASAASARSLRRSAEAVGVATLGAGGLVVVGVLAFQAARFFPSQRAALVAPLLAAALLAGVAVWLARGESASR